MKVLFVVKKRIDSYGTSIGLVNSARFVANALNEMGICAKAVEVIDANNIDKEVHLFKPDHVIIEALWVTPQKLHELMNLHRKIKWVVCIHSKAPFLATEGIAIDWIFQYCTMDHKHKNFALGFNNKEFLEDMQRMVNMNFKYLPNIYIPNVLPSNQHRHHHNKFLNVGCFGAIRPLKNQLEQAIAAIIFAESENKYLRFHINVGRIESRGEAILKNLRFLFEGSKTHKLVEHNWTPHDQFSELLKKMDIGMQVSLSESFNVVAADFVYNHVPIVVSPEVYWMPFICKCRPTDTENMVRRMQFVYHYPKLCTWWSTRSIRHYNEQAKRAWVDYLLEGC